MASIADAKNILGNYFSTEQVQAAGPYVLVIRELSIAKMKNREGEEEEKAVLAFVDQKKKLVLNGTRTDQLQDLFGDGDPAGKTVKLVADTAKAKNGRSFFQICIREAD